MFRKILLSYFPQVKNSEISPIHFHLKLLSSKLFYRISINHSLENRRTIQLDNNFRYFDSFEKKFKNTNDENFYYSYKVFANLNGNNNYNIYVAMPAVLLLTLHTYNKHFELENLGKFLNPLLYGFNYLLLAFFSRFKEYENKSKKENLEFMLELLEEIIFQLELGKDKKKNVKSAQKISKYILGKVKKEPDFLMFIYKTTEKFSKVYEKKKFTDIVFYEYLSSAPINNLESNKNFKEDLLQNCRKIFVERFSTFISSDILILLNIIIGERGYISYITNEKNFDFIFYFITSLKHLNDIDLNKDFTEIIDNVFNFDIRGANFFEALKDFNSDNIDLNLDYSLGLEQVQEIMSKEMMDSVQHISNINEQFLDYFILLISRKINSNGDSLQLYDFEKKYEKENPYNQENYKKLRENYIKLDKQYFLQSYITNSKKKPLEMGLNYNFIDKTLADGIYKQSKRKIFTDFSKKTHTEYINSEKYLEILKKNFHEDIKKILNSKNLKKDYLEKYYGDSFKDKKLEKYLVKNFKENIYYGDFIVYLKFLQFFDIKFNKENLLIASRLRQSLFGYIILGNLSNKDGILHDLYKSGINFYNNNFDLNLEKFYYYFNKQYGDFVDFFTNVSQNQKFAKIVNDMLISAKYKNFYIYENTKDISFYNKRLFRL